MNTDLQARVASTREQFEAELAAKLQERTQLIEAHAKALADLDEDTTVLGNVVAALNGKPALKAAKKPAAKKPVQAVGKRGATGYGISLERASEAAKGIDALLEETGKPTFTQRELYRYLDWDQGTGSAAVRYLRAVGYLRKAGRDNRAELWAVMDRDALTNPQKKETADVAQ